MAVPIVWTDLIVPNGGIDETVSDQKLPANKWSSGLNVEPLADGVRSRLGSTASNATPVQTATLSAVAGTDDRDMDSIVDASYAAQGITIGGTNVDVASFSVQLKIGAGSPVGEIRAGIAADSGGEPGDYVTGGLPGNFSVLDASTVTAGYAWYSFTSDTQITLTAATVYHLVIRHTSGTASDHVSIQEDTGGNPYANGTVNTAGNNQSWTAVTLADLNFKLFANADSEFVAIADYRLADGVTARHLVVAGDSVYKNVAGTMTSVSGTDTLTDDADVLPSWTVGQDRWFMSNNTEVAKKFYITGGTEYWENEGISPPTAVATLGVAAGSGIATGTYAFDYYFWNDDIGQPSNRKYNGVSAVEYNNLNATDHITISGLDAAVVRAGDRATHLRLEVKEPASTIFRKFAEITIGTATATFSSAESAGVEAEYEHAVPPLHKIKAVAENRQFILNVASNPWRLMWSAIVGITPYYESYPATNFRDFGKGDGDYGTCLAFIPPRTLVVGFKNSIWAIDARRPATSDRFLIAKNVGIANHRSFIVVGRKLFFISDAAENKGPYMWDGSGEPQYIHGVDNTFKNFNAARYKYASCAHYAPGDERFQWWTLLSSSSANGDRLLMYDYRLGSWSVYTKNPAGNILGNVEESGVEKLYMGGRDGVEYLQDAGTDDAGSAYTASVTLPAYDYDAQHIIKKHRWVDYLVKAQSGGELTMSIDADYGEQLITVNLDQSAAFGTFTLGTSELGGTATMGVSSPNKLRRISARGKGRVFQPTVSGRSWHLKGVAFGVQPTGRR